MRLPLDEVVRGGEGGGKIGKKYVSVVELLASAAVFVRRRALLLSR